MFKELTSADEYILLFKGYASISASLYVNVKNYTKDKYNVYDITHSVYIVNDSLIIKMPNVHVILIVIDNKHIICQCNEVTMCSLVNNSHIIIWLSRTVLYLSVRGCGKI